MAPVFTENLRRTAGFIVSEANGKRSREQGIVASGAGKLQPGAVLGQVTTTKKFVPVAPAATDGSQNAVAILYEGCDATSADVRRTFVRRHAEVQLAELVWPAGITEPQKTAALAALATHGIVGR